MSSDKKISELTLGTPLDTDIIPYVDLVSGETKKATKSELKGDQGDAATLDVGTTTTGNAGTDAIVTNSGTTSEAIFNFVIPRGDKGEQGEQGIPGINGTKITTVTSNKVGKTTTVTVAGDFIGAPSTFDIEDGADGEGAGDVVGPASSTNGNVVMFDGISGKLIKDSGITLSGNNTGDQDLSGYFDNLNGGCIVTHTFTDNGDGTIDLPSCEVNLWDNSTFQGVPQRYTLPALTGQALTDGVTNYIVGDYNGGTPIMKVITDVNLITESDVIPILSIYRNGIYLHTQNWDSLGVGLANKVHQSIVKTQRYRRESGLALSEYGTRNLNLTDGRIWTGAVPITLDTIASATDNIFLWYHNAGVWTQSVVTQYNNTQYDNGTNLATLTANRYAVNWVYRGVESQKHLYVVLGTGNYTLSQAQASQPPAIPTAISSHGVLVGKIIVQKSIDTATSIESAFDTSFSMSVITSHEDLININQANTGITNGHISDQAQTIYGVKTFNSFSITPSSAPTTDYQVANKKYVDDNAGGGANIKQITIPGELIADTSNYQGLFFYNTSGATITISDVDIVVAKAAAGTGAACAINLYKSSGTAADGINTNATALFTSAIDLTTGYTSLNNTPNTATVENGRWISLRITSSAGATNRASDMVVTFTIS